MTSHFLQPWEEVAGEVTDVCKDTIFFLHVGGVKVPLEVAAQVKVGDHIAIIRTDIMGRKFIIRSIDPLGKSDNARDVKKSTRGGGDGRNCL
ncbi:MAG: hypothetical protein PHZ19_00960 [Candidatus Thermoplasmatota archaeon]|nr:hypothetical protein [Candidatus Thermoplasmatota archaeon]